MNTNSNLLWPTLDAFQIDLAARGPHVAIGRLSGSLAQRRAELPQDAWKASCAGLGDHPALRQLLEDPYSRDARTKSAGYAGDARTLDYVYLRDPGSQPITSVGRALFAVSTGVPIAEAVRARCAALAADITRLAETRPSLSVASIACGHARELDRIPDRARTNLSFWGIDQDSRSIDHCRTHHDGRCTFEVGSVRDIIAGRVRIPASDFIYASGLFDYLDERGGSVLVKRMAAALKPGGRVVVPNLTPRNDEIGYMEAIMDWWMCYRMPDDMRRLACGNDLNQSALAASVFPGCDGRVAWLQIDRAAA